MATSIEIRFMVYPQSSRPATLTDYHVTPGAVHVPGPKGPGGAARRPAEGDSRRPFANGSVHGTFTETGTFVLTDPEGFEGATGHFTFWGGFNANPKQFGFWFTLRAQGETVGGEKFQFNLMGQERAGRNSFAFVQFNCHDGNGPIRVDP